MKLEILGDISRVQGAEPGWESSQRSISYLALIDWFHVARRGRMFMYDEDQGLV